VWVREISKRGEGCPNTHILVHVPPGREADFDAAFLRALEPEGGVNDERAIKFQRAGGPMGKLRYMFEGLVPKDGKAVGIRPKFQGEIVGKRCGMTQNLNRGARRRWQTRRGVLEVVRRVA
jgi:hypothetical protein